jgi:hypothetical protein
MTQAAIIIVERYPEPSPTFRRPRGLRAEAERKRIKKGHPREMAIVPLIAICALDNPMTV